jgi:hypothetical protein
VRNRNQKEQKQSKYDEYDEIDYDEDNLLAMVQYERVMRNSNRIRVNDKRQNKRQNRRYEDEL